MKTITKNQSSCYVLDDSYLVTLGTEGKSMTYVHGEFSFYIADCHKGNAVVYEDITPPNDWVGNKYLYDGKTWTLNPEYQEPIPAETTTGLETL